MLIAGMITLKNWSKILMDLNGRTYRFVQLPDLLMLVCTVATDRFMFADIEADMITMAKEQFEADCEYYSINIRHDTNELTFMSLTTHCLKEAPL